MKTILLTDVFFDKHPYGAFTAVGKHWVPIGYFTTYDWAAWAGMQRDPGGRLLVQHMRAEQTAPELTEEQKNVIREKFSNPTPAVNV